MAAAPKPKEALMPKLTDTQLVILSTAARRQDSAVLPLPKSLKIKGGAATKTLDGLRRKGLLEEKPAARNAAAWREGEDGRRMMLVITDAGLQAIGVDADEITSKQSRSTKPRAKKLRRRVVQKRTAATPKGKKSQTAARQGTKQALLINLLKRKKGATIEAIVETLGWLPHTVRAALTRLRQQGFQIERVREDGVSRYRIVENRKAA
jgi:DNA-binding MarR family transcriptional regulator